MSSWAPTRRLRGRRVPAGTRSSGGFALYRSRPSPRSTAYAWAAASKSLCIATTGPCHAMRVPSHSRKSSSRSFPRGAEPSSRRARLAGRGHSTSSFTTRSTRIAPCVRSRPSNSGWRIGSSSPSISSRNPCESSSPSPRGEVPAREEATGEADAPSLEEAIDRARAFAEAKVHGATRAPELAIDLIEFAALGGDLDVGLEREREALAELLPARQAQASTYSFQLTQQRVGKQPWKPDVAGHALGRVAVVGAGLMGAQLGALFLQRTELPLVMKDIADDVLGKAREHIEASLDERVAKGRLAAGKAAFLKSLVTYTTDDGGPRRLGLRHRSRARIRCIEAENLRWARRRRGALLRVRDKHLLPFRSEIAEELQQPRARRGFFTSSTR